MYMNEFARALAATSLVVSFVCGAASDSRTLQVSRQWGSLGELYCPPEDDCPDSYANSIKFSGNGTRIVVGSPYATRKRGGAWAGFVQVLEHVDGSPVWKQLGTDINGISGDDQFGREVSISADGTRIATVAPRYDVAEKDDTDDDKSIGRLRVFDFDIVEGGDIKDWVEAGAMINVDAAVMSADGTTFVIGRTEESSFGRAGVFRLDGSFTFQQIGGYIIRDIRADSFGEAVAISADGARIAVGATLYDDDGFKKGLAVDDDDYHYDDYKFGNFFPSCFDKNDIDNTKANFGLVRVYDEVNGNWVQVGGDIVGDRACDKFGASIGMSFDGARIVVGAPESDVPYLSDDTDEEPSKYEAAGSVRVLDFTNGAWTDVGQPITGQYRLAQIGTSVAMSANGERIVVGSANGWLSQSLEHPVCIYELVNDEEWETVGKCIQPDVNDNCKSVAMDATGSVVGVTCSNMVKLNPHGGGARIFFQMDKCVKKKNKSRLKDVDVLVNGTLTKAEKLDRKHTIAKDEIETEYKKLREACVDTNCEQEMDKEERKKIKKTKKKFKVRAKKNVAKFDEGETKITNQFVKRVQKKCES